MAAGMAAQQSGAVLVVGGTHGNERHAPWLLESLGRGSRRWPSHGLAVQLEPGNPEALRRNRRYIERDLNRSFLPALLDDPDCQLLEVRRARELLAAFGAEGSGPCLVAIDLHSTTAAMGNSLVVYGRRPADLALAAAIQFRLGLPIYLHEGDPRQSGFLCEAWPCGFVVEVGPAPQGLLLPAIVEQTALALDAILATLASARSGRLRLPDTMVVHRHRRSLDRPRQPDGSPDALLHPLRQHRDWQPLRAGDPLFLDRQGQTLTYGPEPGEPTPLWPVFINFFIAPLFALCYSQRSINHTLQRAFV